MSETKPNDMQDRTGLYTNGKPFTIQVNNYRMYVKIYISLDINLTNTVLVPTFNISQLPSVSNPIFIQYFFPTLLIFTHLKSSFFLNA